MTLQLGRMARISAVCFAGLVMLWITGCGQATGTVSGTVTVGGAPLAAGTITFVGDVGEPKSAGIVDGKYETAAMPVGTYKIMILVRDVPTSEANAAAAKTGVVGSGLGAGDTRPTSTPKTKKLELDPKYADPEKSGLTFPVIAGPNKYDPKL
ncbi:MAG: hypothetical protein ACRC8S_14430 [Fimbriiglobus sp.]